MQAVLQQQRNASTDPTETKQDTAVDVEAWPPHACILYHVHVVEPNVLHTASEVLPCPQTLTDLQEVVQSTDVDLTHHHTLNHSTVCILCHI